MVFCHHTLPTRDLGLLLSASLPKEHTEVWFTSYLPKPCPCRRWFLGINPFGVVPRTACRGIGGQGVTLAPRVSAIERSGGANSVTHLVPQPTANV
jgi:hypothetical protein